MLSSFYCSGGIQLHIFRVNTVQLAEFDDCGGSNYIMTNVYLQLDSCHVDLILYISCQHAKGQLYFYYHGFYKVWLWWYENLIKYVSFKRKHWSSSFILLMLFERNGPLNIDLARFVASQSYRWFDCSFTHLL